MAENNKGGIFNKAEKLLRRRKTKVLQSLGKTGRTTDEQLVEDGHKLEKQQEVANRFQKDIRTYIQSARVLATASKTFYTTLSETYETEWEGHTQVQEILTNMDALWQDYIQKLTEQVQEPLHKYLSHIPSIKARVSKRGRKLIDYDNARHNLEVQQNAKKKDDAKITKAQEDLDQAKKIYEDLNNELHQELPEFYNSRVTFYGNTFERLFSAEAVFHTEAGKGTQRVSEINEMLAKDNEQFTYTPRKNLRMTVSLGSDEPVPNGHGENGNSGYESPQPDSPGPVPTAVQPREEPVVNGTHDADISKDSIADSTLDSTLETTDLNESQTEKTEETTEMKEETRKAEPAPEVNAASSDTKTIEDKEDKEEPKSEKTEEPTTVNGDLGSSTETEKEVPDYPPPQPPASEAPKEPRAETPETPPPISPPRPSQDKDVDETDQAKVPIVEELYQVPPPAKPIDDDLPSKYLFTVTATHPYKGEDDDELTFDTHEVIYVVEHDEPDEQDPGWCMGVRRLDRKCGVFPENFTKRV